MAQQYHIGKNGPAPCNAQPYTPNGRACRYRDQPHGDKAAVVALYERQQEDDWGLVAPLQKNKKHADDSPADEDTSHIEHTKQTLGSIDKYESIDVDEEEQHIAMRVALSNVNYLTYTPVQYEDHDFNTDGISSVHKLVLADGTTGYFKSFTENESLEVELTVYDSTTVGATINEANAYRMSQAMGEGYESLVPETVIREYDGHLGSFQKEVSVPEYEPSPSDRNKHEAAVFDFVIGSKDRHLRNRLVEQSGDNDPQLKLIDNSFAFATNNVRAANVNMSIYTCRYQYEPLNGRDRTALRNADEAVDAWEKEGTISSAQAEGVRTRIGLLQEEDETLAITDYVSYARQMR